MSSKPFHANVREEVYEQLWRVTDTARLISCPPLGITEAELRGKLADDLKMLERAIGFFYGNDEAAVRGTASKHPWTIEIEAEDRRRRLADVESDSA